MVAKRFPKPQDRVRFSALLLVSDPSMGQGSRATETASGANGGWQMGVRLLTRPRGSSILLGSTKFLCSAT